MKLVGNMHYDYAYFKYEHNTNYQQIQKRFLEAVESLNPDNIVVSNHSEDKMHAYFELFLCPAKFTSVNLKFEAYLQHTALEICVTEDLVFHLSSHNFKGVEENHTI